MNGPEKDDRKLSFRSRQSSNKFGILDSFEASNHDYETISLDYTRKAEDGRPDRVVKMHSYAKIPVRDEIEEADSPMEPQDGGLISVAAKDKRNKLMKIDSHGYASVMPPEAQDNFWESNDTQQPPVSSGMDQSPLSSRRQRVSNTEEAWKHQLERGYAPLTLKPQYHSSSAPLMNRTSSDGILSNSLSLVAPGSTPRDYEVPIPRHAPPPPLSITKRKSSSPLIRQNPVFSPTYGHQTFLCDIREKEPDCCDLNFQGGSGFLRPGTGHHSRKHSASDITELTPTPSPVPLPFNSQ